MQTQWEYHTEKFKTDFGFFSGTSFDSSAMNKHLNTLGDSGWELVSIFDINKLKGGSKFIVAVFKRPKINGES